MTDYEVLSLKYMWWQNAIAVGGFVLTIISILGVYIDYRHRKSKEKAEKAIDMAKYFMDEILPGLSVINKMCIKSGIGDLLNKYKFYEYEDFDEVELKELYSNEEIEEIMDVFKNKKIGQEEESMKLGNFAMILLNKLEYMCMFIASKVADGGYIYNSLHQMFLSSIQTLYVNISKQNINEKDKYYTNIIEVYNQWTDRYFEEAKREEKLSQKLDRKIKKLKRRFKKNKKIS